jgi:hypothetical protein
VADYGLAALMGVLGGTGTGLSHSVEDQQKAAALAEQKRQFDLGRLTDVQALPEPLRNLISPDVKQIPNTILPTYEKLRETTDKAAEAKRQQEAWNAFTENSLGLSPQERAFKAVGLGPTAPQATLLKDLTDLGKETPHIIQSVDAQGKPTWANVRTGRQGNITGVETPGIPAVATRSALDQAVTAYQQNPTPENLQRINTLAGTTTVAPGGQAFSKSEIAGFPNPSAQPNAPSATPVPVISRPALSSDETIKGAAQADFSVHEMSDLAGDLRKLGPDSLTRLNQSWRSFAQGVPFLSSIGFLTPEEQGIATRLRHAQLRYEAAISGLRGAGSPQMYERFQRIIGPFYGATTPAALEALSGSMADYLNDLQKYETAGGRQGFPGVISPRPQRPSIGGAPAAPPATPEEPWVDVGNGMKIRKKR